MAPLTVLVATLAVVAGFGLFTALLVLIADHSKGS